ncbi:SH3 domain-containing protein [Sulfitobacter maritimus]|uniref:SH3 domain-containing protein n=1 Tax=Sulfitobacter maritimus TaxID=2741719 RepID=UPI001FEB8FD6|nr:SH3 domain-containing protein [Sulfitobacter maritimus]
MKRFIFLTFGFMGWAFYEMSGGASFDPAGQRTAHLSDSETAPIAQAKTETGKLVTAAAEEAARKRILREQRIASKDTNVDRIDDANVTRVALNLTTLSDLPRAGDMPIVEKAVAKPAVNKGVATTTASISDTGAKVIKASATVPQTAGYTVTSTQTPAIIPSLIDPNDDGKIDASTTTHVSTSQQDIRTVSGNRVNVRRGPGTNFGIVGKLNAGTAVKVIEDNGAGWVRLRALDSNEMGWMAEFLLSAG